MASTASSSHGVLGNHPTHGRCLLALLLAALAAAPALAEDGAEPADPPPPAGKASLPEEFSDFGDIDLENLLQTPVSAVSKHAQTVAEAPATVSVLSREDFARHAWTSVAEALRSVPGLYVSSGRDNYYLGVRGLSFPLDAGTHVLVLLDGHTMNNPWSAASGLDELQTLPVELIERVEILRGPSSSMYGSNAFFAVVNIVSRRPGVQAGDSFMSASLGASSLERYRAHAGGAYRFGFGLELGLHALVLEGGGPEVRFADMTRPRLSLPLPTPSGGITHGTDFERGYNVGARASWEGLALQAQWSHRYKGLPSAPADSIFDDPYNSLSQTHGFLELSYARELDGHQLLARAYYDRFEERQYLHRDPSDWEAGRWFSLDPHTVGEGNDDTLGAEARASLRLHELDRLTAGVEFQRHSISQPMYELDPVSGAIIPESRRGGRVEADGSIAPISYWNIGVYLQNDWRPLDELQVVAGLRFDYNSWFSESGSATDVLLWLSPRAALIYQPVADLYLKLMYGEAFRNPSFFEASFDDGAAVCGNPRLHAERTRSVELAGMWEPRPGLTAGASVFFSSLTDLLQRLPVDECYQGSGPRQQFQNQGALEIAGGELQIAYRNERGLQLSGALTLARPLEEVANSPLAVVSLGASVPLWEDKLLASVGAQFVSERLNWTLDSANPENPYLRLDAALVLRRVLGGLQVSLALTNFLDFSYRDPVSSAETIPDAIPQDGVAVQGKVGYGW
ncbi:MAG TPA: TonB-dependent receptor [Myxococcota bacterium]|nr:TonB-dependent receptor [Myxococcota bacterium]HRY96173.1 TonB-dependent receptor [Myxococcota bacterium]